MPHTKKIKRCYNLGGKYKGFDVLWEKKTVGIWLEKRRRGDKALSAKIRDDAGNKSLNE